MIASKTGALRSLSIFGLLAGLITGCGTIHDTGSTIKVDQPVIFDNAALQAQLQLLGMQLSQLGIVDTGTLTGSLGAIQGTSISESSITGQISVGAGASSAPGALPTALPVASSAPTVPAPSLDAIALIDKQLELESKLQGYQLLIGGSDFARYTRDGLVKDRIVIGFPISLSPGPAERNEAAVVEITYFPPNSGQFPEDGECEQRAYTRNGESGGQSSAEYRFSQADASNTGAACAEQEGSPSIINILPEQRSYNVFKVSSSAVTAGVGAVVGTVNLGVSGGTARQTQYVLADQDTVALEGSGSIRCTDELIDLAIRSGEEHCVRGSRGVQFQWQFRPVLGESFVRTGIRHTFVQLAIPNVRRPYPYYGGIVYLQTSWYPYDKGNGVVAIRKTSSAYPDPGSTVVMNVFGHTFISSELTTLRTHDEGSGQVQVDIDGEYLTGANVRVGSTLLNTTSPGFLADYNSLKFVASAQSLAQNGAYLISTEGVESPIDLTSICKSWDRLQHECSVKWGAEQRPDVDRVRVLPLSGTTSLVEVHVSGGFYPGSFYHYKRSASGDVEGDLVERQRQDQGRPWEDQAKVKSYFDSLPKILVVGAKAYGLSDAPFQSVESNASESGIADTTLSVVAPNDSLNASPQVMLRTLFGLSDGDPDPVSFVPPGNVTISPDDQWMKKHPAASTGTDRPKATNDAAMKAPTDPKSKKASMSNASKQGPDPSSKTPCDSDLCHYVIQGAEVDRMYVGSRDAAAEHSCAVPELPLSAGDCKGSASLARASDLNRNSRALTVPACARQITLNYTVGTGNNRCVTSQLVVGLSTTTAAAPPTPGTTAAANGPSIPHLSLIRAVTAVRDSNGTATFAVDIKNLKDQTATVTVLGAEIVSAEDGAKNGLPIQVGNDVIVSQDTSLTIQVRNYGSGGFNVSAEGKNGTISTGTVKFGSNFIFLKTAPSAGSSAPAAKTQ